MERWDEEPLGARRLPHRLGGASALAGRLASRFGWASRGGLPNARRRWPLGAPTSHLGGTLHNSVRDTTCPGRRPSVRSVTPGSHFSWLIAGGG